MILIFPTISKGFSSFDQKKRSKHRFLSYFESHVSFLHGSSRSLSCASDNAGLTSRASHQLEPSFPGRTSSTPSILLAPSTSPVLAFLSPCPFSFASLAFSFPSLFLFCFSNFPTLAASLLALINSLFAFTFSSWNSHPMPSYASSFSPSASSPVPMLMAASSSVGGSKEAEGRVAEARGEVPAGRERAGSGARPALRAFLRRQWRRQELFGHEEEAWLVHSVAMQRMVDLVPVPAVLDRRSEVEQVGRRGEMRRKKGGVRGGDREGERQ
jgi:hypothetical protein